MSIRYSNLLFSSSVPDPHNGFYSENVFGANGELVNYISPDWWGNTWLGGYYSHDSSSLNNAYNFFYISSLVDFSCAINSEEYGGGKIDAYVNGWLFHINFGWVYFHVSQKFVLMQNPGNWFWLQPLSNMLSSGWIFMAKKWGIKDYKLSESQSNSILSTWMNDVLDLTSDTIDGTSLSFTAGEGVLAYIYQNDWAIIKFSANDETAIYYKLPSDTSYSKLLI